MCKPSEIIDVIDEVYLFFHLSPKRQRFLELVLDVCAPNSRVKKLKGLCKTRWTERHDCLETFHSLYEYIHACLDAMVKLEEYPSVQQAMDEQGLPEWAWDASTQRKAVGLRDSLQKGENIVALVTMLLGLDPVKGLSSKLQKLVLLWHTSSSIWLLLRCGV